MKIKKRKGYWQAFNEEGLWGIPISAKTKKQALKQAKQIYGKKAKIDYYWQY